MELDSKIDSNIIIKYIYKKHQRVRPRKKYTKNQLFLNIKNRAKNNENS